MSMTPSRAFLRNKQALRLAKLPGMPKRLENETPSLKGPFKHMWTPDHLAPKHRPKKLLETNENLIPNPVFPKDRIRQWVIVEGDVVKIVSGDFSGRIGRVLSVDKLRNEVFIDGVNLKQQEIPKLAQDLYGSAFTTVPGPISIHDVRLTEEIFDETGDIQIKEIDKLVAGKVYWKKGKAIWNRWVEEENRTIPYPPSLKDDENLEDYPCDTQKDLVQEKTFIVDFEKPIPNDSVAEELGSKTSSRARKAWGRQYYMAREREIMERILLLNANDPQKVQRKQKLLNLKKENIKKKIPFTEKELKYIEDALKLAS